MRSRSITALIRKPGNSISTVQKRDTKLRHSETVITKHNEQKRDRTILFLFRKYILQQAEDITALCLFYFC